MGGLSIWHILLLAAIVLLLFGGRGKVSDFMGDFAKGIRNFRKGLADEDPQQPRSQIPENNKDTAPHP
jgi:sec-independent protein translocase protein TatA